VRASIDESLILDIKCPCGIIIRDSVWLGLQEGIQPAVNLSAKLWNGWAN